MRVTLDEIVAVRRRSVARSKAAADMAQLERAADAHVLRGFRNALMRRAEVSTAVIAELKKASPSRGVIRENFQVRELAIAMRDAGAVALSVLTEPEFFAGSLENLRAASEASDLPCLRKDFIVDEFQLLEARANGADAVLLICAALKDAELKRLTAKAEELGLDVLCEVHDGEELARARDAGCDIIGVNNRDLRSFRVDLEVALRLAERTPSDVVRVAESGIQTADDIRRLRDAGYQAFLIGESLMKAREPGEALRVLIEESSTAGAPRHGVAR